MTDFAANDQTFTVNDLDRLTWADYLETGSRQYASRSFRSLLTPCTN